MEGLQRSRQKQQRRRQEGRRGREEEAGEQEQGAGRAAEAAVTEDPRTSDGASRGARPGALHLLQAPSQCLLSGSNRIVSTESTRLPARKLPGLPRVSRGHAILLCVLMGLAECVSGTPSPGSASAGLPRGAAPSQRSRPCSCPAGTWGEHGFTGWWDGGSEAMVAWECRGGGRGKGGWMVSGESPGVPKVPSGPWGGGDAVGAGWEAGAREDLNLT